MVTVDDDDDDDDDDAGAGAEGRLGVTGFAGDEVFTGETDCAALGFTDPVVAPALTDPLAGTGDVGALVADAAAAFLAADGAAGGAGDVAETGVDSVGVLGAGAAAGLETVASASPEPAEATDGAASTPVNDGRLASLVKVVASAAGVVLCRARAKTR